MSLPGVHIMLHYAYHRTYHCMICVRISYWKQRTETDNSELKQSKYRISSLRIILNQIFWRTLILLGATNTPYFWTCMMYDQGFKTRLDPLPCFVMASGDSPSSPIPAFLLVPASSMIPFPFTFSCNRSFQALVYFAEYIHCNQRTGHVFILTFLP